MGNEGSKKTSKSREVSPRQMSNQFKSPQAYDLSKFVVITVIFNPAQYKNRYELYHRFASHIAQSGVNLITVECIFETTPRFGLPPQSFQVTSNSHPNHIQIIAPSILWMKENLINIAIQRLPSIVEYVAWVDADIEFDNLAWPHLTIGQLQQYPIVQMYELAYFLGPNGKQEVLRRDYSFGYSIRHAKIIDPRRYNEWYPHPGYAWAMRRDVFNAIGGLIDFCIVGSGDLHFAFALLGRIEETVPPNMHQDYKTLALRWGSQVAQIAGYGEKVGYVPVNLWHFWHGTRDNRNYVDRWAILTRSKYSPLNDLVINQNSKIIRLVDATITQDTNKLSRLMILERDIFNYFKSRNEDSTKRSQSAQAKSQAQPKKQSSRVLPVFKPHHSSGSSRPSNVHFSHWTSGPSGTHVDDCNPYYENCQCIGGHHDPCNQHCPCDHHQTGGECWEPNPHHETHHDYDHHHPTGGECWEPNPSYDNQHDHSSYGNNYHSGVDSGCTDYGGHGSFY